jgi:hypothetical protein
MSPTCSKAALRVLASVWLAASAADAAALRHQALDARDPMQQQNAQIAADAIQAAASVIADDPTNFFEDVSDDLSHRSAWSLIQDFFERLFGPRDDSPEPTATIIVTPTPAPVETASISLVLPLEPSSVSSSDASSVTSAPGDIMSILPVGSLTTAINATFLTPVFSTAPEESPVATPSVIEIIAPFPVLNATGSVGIFPTAVSVTGEFSVIIPLPTGVSEPAAVNSSVPVATIVAPAFNFTATFPALDPSLVTGGYHPTPLSNATAAPLNGTANETSIVIVTATVTPIPVVLVTGTAVVSAGTGLPVVIIASPIWSNSTYGDATAVAPIGIGTGSPIIGTGVPIIGTGSPVIGTVIPIIGTGSPVVGTVIPIIGTGSPMLPTAVPIPSGGYYSPKLSEIPVYPNITIPTPIALPFPISVTFPEPANITAPANVTSAAAPAQVTFDPPAVTGTPGSVISVVIPLPVYPNITFPTEVVTSAAPSVGTALPIPESIDTPLYVNTTTATSLVIETATAILIIPPPGVTEPAVETPGNASSPFSTSQGGYGN